MHNFRFVTKKEYQPIKEELLELIHLVQDEVREHFTFRYDFIGSASRNTITTDEDSNVGYDFDVNIEVNDPDNNYSPKKIRNILKTAFDKYAKSFGYSYAEDSKRVITIKVKDQKHKKILHSCDFAVVNNYEDEMETIDSNSYISIKAKAHMNGRINLPNSMRYLIWYMT